MANKLNSMRFLETNGVPYDAATFDASVHDAVEVARLLGAPPETVYKTLVVERPGGKPMLVMIASNRHLDLKRLAAETGHKKLNMASHNDAEKLTGLKVGGISALALVHKRWDVLIDRPALDQSHIYVSAGQRGVNLRVPVADLIRILNVKVVDASSDMPA
ncbi:MAG: aminoacyl-tRNA deacylase [Anaerolineae bacterium]|nr:aminoacyl-tRNA deacylase [Anaerolineae bacterium]